MKYFKTGLLTLMSFAFSFLSFSQIPTAKGNVMFFSSVASYETYAENENTWSSLINIAQQSSTLTTMAEKAIIEGKGADTLYPDFLKEILNTDNILQIGNYLIKIDLANERGLIISAKNNNSYFSLVKNDVETPGMMVLDGDEDFGLELLESLESKNVKTDSYLSFLTSARACRGAKRVKPDRAIEEWTTTNEDCDNAPTIGRTYGMDNKLVYQKAIIYFSLQSKIRSIWRCTFGGTWAFAPIYFYVDLKLTGTVKYRRRCESEVNNSVALEEGYFGGGNGILDWRAYGGGRSLSHYDLNVDFAIRPAVDRTPNPPAYTPSRHYRIVYGY